MDCDDKPLDFWKKGLFSKSLWLLRVSDPAGLHTKALSRSSIKSWQQQNATWNERIPRHYFFCEIPNVNSTRKGFCGPDPTEQSCSSWGCVHVHRKRVIAVLFTALFVYGPNCWITCLHGEHESPSGMGTPAQEPASVHTLLNWVRRLELASICP